jgi:hypothetical protein
MITYWIQRRYDYYPKAAYADWTSRPTKREAVNRFNQLRRDHPRDQWRLVRRVTKVHDKVIYS